jgi:uncharacterized protein (TIGR02996 family)
MSDREAFLRTILENPDDDLPRLVFADWLQENGDEDRADFIRIQCELAQTPKSDPRRKELESRSQAYLRLHQVQWQSDLPYWEGVRWETFERGFVASVRVDSPQAFFLHAKEIIEYAPIQHLSFHRFYAEHAKQLANVPPLKQIRSLDLEDGNRIGNLGLEALAESPYLPNLRSLKLGGNGLGPASVRALAHSKTIDKLMLLDLHRNDLFDDGAEALATSEQMKSLENLRLGYTQLTDAGVSSIANSPYLNQLWFLYLSTNFIQSEGAISIARSPYLRDLEELYLDYNQIGNEGAIALANSRMLANLEVLYLRRNGIGDKGGHALASSPYLQEIKEISLGENQFLMAYESLRNRFGGRVMLQ